MNVEDHDSEVVPASTRLVVTVTFKDADIRIKEMYMDMLANSDYRVIVDGKEIHTNEYEPAKPVKLNGRKVQFIISNTDTSSQTYGRILRGWGVPR